MGLPTRTADGPGQGRHPSAQGMALNRRISRRYDFGGVARTPVQRMGSSQDTVNRTGSRRSASRAPRRPFRTPEPKVRESTHRAKPEKFSPVPKTWDKTTVFETFSPEGSRRAESPCCMPPGRWACMPRTRTCAGLAIRPWGMPVRESRRPVVPGRARSWPCVRDE